MGISRAYKLGRDARTGKFKDAPKTLIERIKSIWKTRG